MRGPADLASLMEAAKKEFPDFRVAQKSGSRLMKAIGYFLLVASFGKNRGFMRSYYTTVGFTVYAPESYLTADEESKVGILRHELVHMRQARRYGRLLFSLLYLLVFFPVGLAYFRAKFEKEAYEESLRALAELRGVDALRSADPDRVIKHFVSSDYLWMWPFRRSMQKWYSATVEKIIKEVEA